MAIFIGSTAPDLSSILAAAKCETCRQSTLEKPTIVRSAMGNTPSHICKSRDIAGEWALNAVLHSTAWRDRPDVPATPIDGQIESSRMLESQLASDAFLLGRIEDLLARFSLAKTGWCLEPSVVDEVVQFAPHETTFADACLSAVSQVSDLAIKVPPGLELDNGPSIKFTVPEVYALAAYIENRPETTSCQSYRSILEKIPVKTKAEQTEAISYAIRNAELDPGDFVPRESAFRGNPSQAFSDIVWGEGRPFTGV